MRKLTKYKVVLHREKDGGYVVTVPNLRGCLSQGDTRGQTFKNTKEKPSNFTWKMLVPHGFHQSPITGQLKSVLESASNKKP